MIYILVKPCGKNAYVALEIRHLLVVPIGKPNIDPYAFGMNFGFIAIWYRAEVAPEKRTS